MSAIDPNCFHLINSQFLKKEDRHPSLVMASAFDGWLLPLSSSEILEKYPQYLNEKVFDPIIEECAEVQKLLYKKKIIKSKKDKVYFDLEKYCRGYEKNIQQLKAEGDPVVNQYIEEHDGFLESIEQIEREVAHLKNKSKSKDSSTPNFTRYTLDDLLAMPPKEWIVENVFGEGDLGVVYGPPGCGKTFVVIDFILKLCAGRKWAHRFEVKRALNVAYCAGEGHGALPDRFRVAVNHHNLSSGLENFTYLKEVPQLFDENDSNYIVKFVNDQQKLGKKLDLLVIDTLITASSGADENSSQDMRKIIEGCKIAIKSLGCAVLLVHHTNKNEEVERGSSALRGACDFMIKIKKSSEEGVNASIECSKSKDGEPWLPQNFNLCQTDGFKSVHVAWDIVGVDNGRESKESTKVRILEILSYYPEEKFTCKAISNVINQNDKITGKLLNTLFDEGKCIRSREGKSTLTNPWLYSNKKDQI